MITRDELVRELERAEWHADFAQTNRSCFGGSIDVFVQAVQRYMRAREALIIYDSALEACARDFETLLKDIENGTSDECASDEYIDGRSMGITLCLNVINKRGEK